MKAIKISFLLSSICCLQFVCADDQTLRLASTASYPQFTETQYDDTHNGTDYSLTLTTSYVDGCNATSYSERYSLCTYLKNTSNLLPDSSIATQFNNSYSKSNMMRLNTKPSDYTAPAQLDYTVTGTLYIGYRIFQVSDDFTYALDPDGKTFWIAIKGATVTGQHMNTPSGYCIYAHDNRTINIVMNGDSDYSNCEKQ